jgi:hypothetical protein
MCDAHDEKLRNDAPKRKRLQQKRAEQKMRVVI